MGRDKMELKAAAGVQSRDPSQRIFKGHTQLKNANKSITVRMDDTQQRQRGGSAGSALPQQHRGHAQRR